MKRIILVVLVTLLTHVAFAVETGNGRALLKACQIAQQTTKFDAWQVGYCDGIATGVSQLAKGLNLIDDERSQGVTVGQVELIVIKYLTDHPEQLQLNDTYLVLTALQAAFPVKATK